MASLFIISAPSGTGKTSLVKDLVASLPNVSVSVSHTTRPARPGEVEGVNYHFTSKDKFEAMLAEGAFIEHASVYGHYYGTTKAEVESRIAGGEDVILEIEWQGARQVRRVLPEAKSIFILPPNPEALRERLQSRGQDSQAVIDKRLALAAHEVRYHEEYDYLIVNDQFELALSDLRSILRAEDCRQAVQAARYHTLLEGLKNLK